ncbi:MAG: tetratricopeptide repeat protein [Nitrospira sp.]|nr:tetratricopeptide repeat protein [Nitrospira sp.]
MNIDKALQLAAKHYQAGDLQQAEHIYREILKVQPDNTDVLHFIGIVFYQIGNYDLAIQYLIKTLELQPNNADVYYNLGNAYVEKGQFDEAIDCFKKSLQLNPNIAEAYNNLGVVIQKKGSPNDALPYFQKAFQLNHDFIDAYYNLGNALKEKGQFDEAITYYQKALEIDHDHFMAHYSLGNVFQEKGLLDKALKYYQKAMELNSTNPDIYNDIGTVLQELGQFDEAITYYQKALQFNQNFVKALCNMGNVLQRKGKYDEAVQFYQKVMQLDPQNIDAHFNMSLILLLSGKFKEGWEEYEWRWKLKDFYRRDFPQPLWDGSNIRGLTILLHAEQGFGDTIQFIRYAPLVAERGAKVIFECHRELKSLFQNVHGIQQVIAPGEQLPEFKLQCPLLRLPFIFDTTLETIPSKIPYITVTPVLIQKWRDKIRHDDFNLKIGLAWFGNPKHYNDQTRSCSLDTFLSLVQLDNFTFYSLQKREGAEQSKFPPEGMKLLDLTDEIKDFSDTAALIENLDLIISVDTAVAHLAGALGKPVWTLLPFTPDWRWMLNREDSPWYPTMRLFRQYSPGDWKSVTARIVEDLRALIRRETIEGLEQST